MLTREENELVTRVGPGTPMGNVLRRYWIPALMSRELPEPDCPPVRVKLLGEKLVGFRDSQGRIGLVDEFCPHRRASLWFGRNEESGLRCIYHGWKFDVEGKCVEQMNEPEPFCHKVRLTAYPATEIGGVIWAYMVACPDPASHDHPEHQPPRHPGSGPVRAGQGADPRSRRHRLRLPLCRDPPAGRRQDLCALLPFRDAVHANPAAAARTRAGRRRPDQHRRAHLGPDR
ncbi:MAG: Rieske 2Fe-2S domain-containing protein [Alphaproteobacteria bacterium]|nr:MAG: Rieske 2Fe-2S domain-containing protein [Alphaproteobacteria bacterium]